MEYWTLADIKDKVKKETDTEGEEFIQESELEGYINAAIDDAEAEIHALYEDYFLAKTTINLVSGTEEYTLPTNIYANKIRGVIYKNGDRIYEVPRLRHKNNFVLREIINQYNTSDDYNYMVINSSGAANPKLLLVPPARDTVTGGLVLWYIRNANKLTDDEDTCDIPEFIEYVIQYAKCEIWKKEGHPNLELELQERERLRRLMVDTLSNMVPDGDTAIQPDLSHYEEMS